MQIVGDSNSSDMTIFKREKYIQAKFDLGCCCSWVNGQHAES